MVEEEQGCLQSCSSSTTRVLGDAKRASERLKVGGLLAFQFRPDLNKVANDRFREETFAATQTNIGSYLQHGGMGPATQQLLDLFLNQLAAANGALLEWPHGMLCSPGRRCAHGWSASKLTPARNTVASSKRRPTIWRPTGSPSAVNPAGMVRAGLPLMLNG